AERPGAARAGGAERARGVGGADRRRLRGPGGRRRARGEGRSHPGAAHPLLRRSKGVDVNGTRFHLIDGKADWQRCLDETARHGAGDAAWDDRREVLTLAREPFFFLPRGRREVPLEPAARRGADFDRFGNVYWVGRDRRTVWWLPFGGGRAS